MDDSRKTRVQLIAELNELRAKAVHAPGGAAEPSALESVARSPCAKGPIGVSPDITERKKKEASLAEANARLRESASELKTTQAQIIQQERLNALGQMASGIAHDFNNVLMPIIGFTDMLLADPKALDDRQETINILEVIRSCGEDARRIVQRLRQIYKDTTTEYTQVSLATILEGAVSLLTPRWKNEMWAKGIEIEMITDFDDVPSIKGNTSELREGFMNLILNAVDAMPDGGAITLRLKAAGERGITVEVSDTGIGMSEDTVRRCMEPFFSTKGLQGTGLGLSMVYGIVQRHGGTLDIDSKPGVGTTIRMLFPLPAGDAFKKTIEEKSNEPMVPLKVLVIEDDARTRNLIAKLLQSDGHAVAIAKGGQEGIDLVIRNEFDLVITDRAMPGMRGDELVARIVAERPGTPVIMLTGFGDIMKETGEIPTGVTRVMAKPVYLNDLRHAMKAVMRAAGEQGCDRELSGKGETYVGE